MQSRFLQNTQNAGEPTHLQDFFTQEAADTYLQASCQIHMGELRVSIQDKG